jgi:transcriptional regulator with XRE-family HTH domain
MQPFEPAVPNLREDFGLTRKTLSRLTGLSERTLASWESGNKLNEANERALTTADRLLKALAEVVRKDAIAPWLEMPNDAFGGLKPVEVMERGESDRLWRMIYQLGSGSAS